MATKKKLLQAAAGTAAAGGGGLNVEDVFSTYLFEGNATSRDISNGVDLTEGGLVWLKNREGTDDHLLFDTERGPKYRIKSNATDANLLLSGDKGVTAFNSDGFTLGASGVSGINTNGIDDVSWTFRKAPKFFDVVTYTGTGSAQNISHNLGSVPAVMFVKSLDSGSRWNVYHKDASPTGNPENGRMALNTTDAWAEYPSVSVFAGLWNQTAPTDSVFTVGSYNDTNASGENFVAYLFAHNDGDGEFGPDGDADIIKCGSFTGSSSTEVDLGFEPQWLLVKASSLSQDWRIMDNMRGITDGEWVRLAPNDSSAEASFSGDYLKVTPTGFVASQFNTGQTFIYIAIRRGPMAVPESATDVFHALTRSGNDTITEVTGVGFPVDMLMANSREGGYYPGWTYDRLRGEPYLLTPSTGAEVFGASTSVTLAGYMDGYLLPDSNPNRTAASAGYVDYAWKRAPSFFDVVAYTGNGTAGRTVSHNLGVAPEMIWVKRRNDTDNWIVYHSGLNLDGDGRPETDYAVLDNGNAFDGTLWNDTAPTATEFTVGFQGSVNDTYNNNYIAYLFASLDGVSKVFSVTKSSGSDASVNCGFSAGPRFVLLKRTDISGDWYVWDSERGIVSGNDPYLLLNSTAAEVTSTDYIDPTSNGFTIVNGGLADGDYIGYAVA